MTRYNVDKQGRVTVVQEEVKVGLDGLLNAPSLHRNAPLLDRKAEPVDWTKVDWPFKNIFDNRLLIQISEFEYHGALEIPDDAKRDPTVGRVVMIGSGVTDIQIGDRVLYSQFAGYLLKFEGIPKCRIMGRDEVLAQLKEKTPKLVMEGA